MGDSGELESWEYQGGTFTSSRSWIEVGGNKIIKLNNDIEANLYRLSSILNNYWEGLELPSVSLVDGFIGLNGNLEEAVTLGDKATDYISVEPNSSYTYSGKLLDARVICAYDSEKVFIKALVPQTGGKIISIVNFITPENAAYIRASVYYNGGAYKVYKNGTEIPELSALITNVETKLLPMVGDIVDTSSFSKKEGYYINENGKEFAIPGTNIWDISNLKKETLYMFANAPMADARAIVFYDSDGNIIEAYNGYKLGFTVNGRKTFSLMTPTNLSKVRLSYAKSNEVPTILEVCSVNYMQIYSAISKISNFVNQEIDSIKDDVFSLDNKIGLFKEPSLEKLPNVGFTPDGNYYISKRGVVTQGFEGDKTTDYIPVEGNTWYKYTGYFTDARGYAEYDDAKSFVKGSDAREIDPATRKVTTYKFKTQYETKYVRFSVFHKEEYSLEKTSESINEVLISLQDSVDYLNSILNVDEKDFSCVLPKYIFAIDNDSSDFYAREYVQYLYPEGILESAADIQINGGKYYPIQRRTKNSLPIEEENFSLKLTGNGYKTKTGQCKLIKTKASKAKNISLRYLAIGDSITANQIPNSDGKFVGGWCYPSVAKEMLLMDNEDFGDNSLDMLLIGTTNFKETSFNYKDKSINLRGLSEGRGSWTTCNYLRHAMHTITTGSQSDGGSFRNKGAWDALGLGRKIPIDSTYNEDGEYEEYDYSSEKRNLIRTTPWGKYHWNYSVDLWNAAKKNNVNSIMNGAGEYTGSAEDKELLDTYMNYVLDNPNNPFFDKNKAKETGDYAFSLKTYIERYKTLQDDGKTRLVVGSTAGTKISEANINKIDVCTPTHISIELGENERWWYPATAEQTCDDIEKLMEIINEEYPDIKVGFINPRYIGVFYPEKWYDTAICGEMATSNLFKYQINKIMQERFGELETQTQNYFLPCYYVQSPLYRQTSRYDMSLLDMRNIIVGGTDPNHPGLLTYWSIGYQVLSWLYYTV